MNCDECNTTVSSDRTNPVVTYEPQQTVNEVCGDCYDAIISEGRHLHPENRL